LVVVTEPERFDEAVRAARSGDADALAALYRLLHPRLLRYLLVLEHEEAEDLASDTWLDVVGALGRFHGDERALVALGLTIARRRAVDLRRRRGRRRTIPMDPEQLVAHAEIGDTEAEAVDRIALEEALGRLRGLPRDQAEVVLLRVIGGLSSQEVARIVGKRPGNVRVLQHRALRALAATIGEPARPSEGVTR
jgi:RNA polymerase sigma-70 factor (ECF subfamily)